MIRGLIVLLLILPTITHAHRFAPSLLQVQQVQLRLVNHLMLKVIQTVID